MKRSSLLSNMVRIALSLAALSILFREVGGRRVFEELQQANWALLVLAMVLFLLGVVVRAFRWRALLLGLGLRPPLVTLLRLYLVGGFFNTFLPSGFGGDVVRVLELGRGEQDRAAALGTVVVDRLTGILSLMGLGLVVLPFASGLTLWLRWGYVAIAVGGLGAGLLLLEGHLLRRLTGWLPPSLSLTGQGKLAQLYTAVTGSGRRALVSALLLSTLFNVLNVVVHWLCAKAMGIDLSFGFYFIVVPLLSLTLLLPISVGGLGARDWVAQILLAPTGVTQSQTAAWTLSVWAVTAAVGLLGGVIYLVQSLSDLAARRPEEEPQPPASP